MTAARRIAALGALAVTAFVGVGPSAAVGQTGGGSSISGYGLSEGGDALVPVGPLRACSGGGTACLADGEPVGAALGSLGVSVPSLGTLLVRSLVVRAETHGTTRVASLIRTSPSTFEVAALSGVLPVVPGRNDLAPMVAVQQGDTVALTDVRALSHGVGEPRVTEGLGAVGPVGSVVTTVTGPERGLVPYRLIAETDRDADGVVDSADWCHGPGTGALCAVRASLEVASRPERVAAGQPAWFDVTMSTAGPPLRAQAMGALVDVAITPGDVGVALPGECAEANRSAGQVLVTCRASWLGWGGRPLFPLKITPNRPGGAIAATASLRSLKLRDAEDVDVPLAAPVVPAGAGVTVLGLEAFRARVTPLRARSSRAVRLSLTCPGGWTLTTCPVSVLMTDPKGRRLAATQRLRLRPGARRVVTVALTASARRQFARRRVLAVRIVTVRSDVAGGQVRDTVRATLRR